MHGHMNVKLYLLITLFFQSPAVFSLSVPNILFSTSFSKSAVCDYFIPGTWETEFYTHNKTNCKFMLVNFFSLLFLERLREAKLLNSTLKSITRI